MAAFTATLFTSFTSTLATTSLASALAFAVAAAIITTTALFLGELEVVSRRYEKLKNSPPLTRNVPPVTNIWNIWTRNVPPVTNIWCL